MVKDIIKQKLRESLMAKLTEKGQNTEDKTSDSNSTQNHGEIDKDAKKKVQTLTKKIHNATQGPGKLLKLSQVMDAAGVGDANDATDRSEFGKKVSGKPDSDGKIRHLTPGEAAKMGKVVDNPIAFK